MQVDSHSGIKTEVKTDPNLTAPVAVGQQVGTATITAPDFPAMTIPVVAAQPVDGAGFFQRVMGLFGKK
jgi:D-alanyl-D-alanine carboxypeptidase (penicillin-binding protein 5/6)